MKAPVCEICLKSGILCKSCNEKVESGIVSKTEVKVAEALLKLSGEKKQLRGIEILKVAESPEMLVVVCGEGSASRMIGASGQIVRKLEKEFGKRIMIVEGSGDMNQFIRSLLKPLTVVSINTLYKQGRETIKVVTSGRRHGQRISAKDFSGIIKAMYGKEAEIAGE